MADAVGAMVLAGGKSERMGQDKARLAYGENTLLEHILGILNPLVEEVVVVTNSPNRFDLPGVRQIADLFPDCGPVGGILTGLTVLPEGRHLVVACDMPHLQPAVLRYLLDAATPEWDAVVPEIGGRSEPLCAVYRSSAGPALHQFLATGQRAAHKALEMLHVCTVGEDELRRLDPLLATFTNLNTPQDLAALESLPR